MPGSLRLAVVCSSNQNRSMEAHAFLSKKGFKVRSFGSGAQVKLPGSAPDKPNVYDFGVTYEQMYQDLMEKDKALYTQNGILHMLDRNRRIKPTPERFQSCYDKFDVIFTVEERVYDQVVEELSSRLPCDNSPVHIINLDIQDNHEEATIGAFLICEMAQMIEEPNRTRCGGKGSKAGHDGNETTKMSESEDLDNDIDELIQEFEAKAQRPILHTVQFY